MRVVFIYGLPATGKLTVAQELAAMTGYKLFHNHLVVDLLLSVFDFGSPPFVELREDIWLSVFNRACRSQTAGLIFTFAPEATVRPGFVQEAMRAVAVGNGEVDFVELICPVAELKRRLGNASRQSYQKLTSVEVFEQLMASGSFDVSHMPEPRLTIDTGVLNPLQAATLIMQKLELGGAR
jgi:AAA domain